mmetsp:Transcript_7517/g.24040  ORF Transcript_7517/g.24040 Transcript_7517/m.24040 type:complete len:641 (-) Transcript_7517:80-2002(-)
MASPTTTTAAPAAAATPAVAPPAGATDTSAPAAGTPYASASLYVGDLAPDVSEGVLYDVFSVHGLVASIRVCRDAVTRRSLGYAYVNFHSVPDAERALENVNSAQIKGRPCRVMWSQRDPSARKSGAGNIFIKNLPKDMDHKQLFDTFCSFGTIMSCKVVLDDTGASKGYGFVHYDSEESAQKAIAAVNGAKIEDKELFVAPFVPKKERQSSSTTFTNLYIKQLPDNIQSDSDLLDMFKPFGTVTSVHLSMDPETKKSKGFGFVNYDDAASAKAALDELNGKEFPSTVEGEPAKVLYVGRAQKKSEREAELRQKMEELRAERQSKYQGVNLYVKNLEDTVDDDQLRKIFESCGTITSCKVMRDEKTGSSKGFGFVCFSTAEEATNAVTEMNNHMIGTKPLYVAVAQRREVRRAALEQQHARRAQKGMPAAMPGQPGMFQPGAQMFYAAGGMAPQQQAMMYQNMMAQQGRVGRGAPIAPGAWGAPAGAPGFGMPPQYIVPANFAGMANMAGRGGRGVAPGGAANRGTGRGGPAAGRGAGRGAARADGAAGVESIASQPLDVKAIQRLSSEQQKLVVGEKLYPLVAEKYPELAGKITGMLLDSYFTEELCHLMTTPEALNAKINEAIVVLQEHAAKQQAASK